MVGRWRGRIHRLGPTVVDQKLRRSLWQINFVAHAKLGDVHAVQTEGKLSSEADAHICC